MVKEQGSGLLYSDESLTGMAVSWKCAVLWDLYFFAFLWSREKGKGAYAFIYLRKEKKRREENQNLTFDR